MSRTLSDFGVPFLFTNFIKHFLKDALVNFYTVKRYLFHFSYYFFREKFY